MNDYKVRQYYDTERQTSVLEVTIIDRPVRRHAYFEIDDGTVGECFEDSGPDVQNDVDTTAIARRIAECAIELGPIKMR